MALEAYCGRHIRRAALEEKAAQGGRWRSESPQRQPTSPRREAQAGLGKLLWLATDQDQVVGLQRF